MAPDRERIRRAIAALAGRGITASSYSLEYEDVDGQEHALLVSPTGEVIEDRGRTGRIYERGAIDGAPPDAVAVVRMTVRAAGGGVAARTVARLTGHWRADGR